MSKDAQYAHARAAQKFFGDAIQACLNNKSDDLKALLEKYLTEHPQVTPDDVFDSFKSEGKTLVHVAASGGHMQIISYILSVCSNKRDLVNMIDDNGFSPLINATISESISVMEVLLENGADVNVQNNDGAAAIHFAAGDGSVPRLRLLISKGADVTLRSKSGTCLHWAAGKGHADAIQFLIENGVDINVLSPEGLPPVLLAAVACSSQSVTHLVKAGANVGYIVTGNLTLLHICAEHGLVEAVQSILEVESGRQCCMLETTDGNLPIHLAAMSEHREIVELLLGYSLVQEPEEGSEATTKVVGIVPGTTTDSLIADGHARLEAWNKAHHAKAASAAAAAAAHEAAKTTDIEKKWVRRELESSDPVSDPVAIAASVEWKEKGNQAFLAKDYRGAIAGYTEAIKLQGDNHVLWSNRSACYLTVGELMYALQDAEVCRSLNPTWPKACYRLAAARLELGYYEDAAVAAFEGCKLDESNKELKALMKKAVDLGREQHQKQLADEEREKKKKSAAVSQTSTLK